MEQEVRVRLERLELKGRDGTRAGGERANVAAGAPDLREQAPIPDIRARTARRRAKDRASALNATAGSRSRGGGARKLMKSLKRWTSSRSSSTPGTGSQASSVWRSAPGSPPASATPRSAPCSRRRHRRHMVRVTPSPARSDPRSRSPARRPLSRACSPPEQTEGPYYIASEPFRSDVTEEPRRPSPPAPFEGAGSDHCKRIEGATVEIWHCDAGGNYSGFSSGFGPHLPARPADDERSRTRVTFETIYRAGTWAGRPTSTSRSTPGARWSTPASSISRTPSPTAVYAKATVCRTRSARHDQPRPTGSTRKGGARSMLRLRERHQGYRGKMVLGVHA